VTFIHQGRTSTSHEIHPLLLFTMLDPLRLAEAILYCFGPMFSEEMSIT